MVIFVNNFMLVIFKVKPLLGLNLQNRGRSDIDFL
jgi:hypothetical protein